MDEIHKSELLLSEIPALRNEINVAIERTDRNENFCLGLISTIFVVTMLETGFLKIDLPLARVTLSILSVLISFFGWRRYFELKSHISKLDSYIQNAEKLITPSAGWTTHYYQSIEGRWTGGFSVTRVLFWLTLVIISTWGFFHTMYHLNIN